MAILMPPPPRTHTDDLNEGKSAPLLQQKRRRLPLTAPTVCKSSQVVASDEVPPLTTTPSSTSPTRFIADSSVTFSRSCRSRGKLALKVAMWLLVLIAALGAFYPHQDATQVLFRKRIARVVSNSRWAFQESFQVPVVALASSCTTTSSPAKNPTFQPRSKNMRSCQDRFQPTSVAAASSKDNDDNGDPTLSNTISQDNQVTESHWSNQERQSVEAMETMKTGPPQHQINFAWMMFCNLVLTTSLIALSHCYYQRPIPSIPSQLLSSRYQMTWQNLSQSNQHSGEIKDGVVRSYENRGVSSTATTPLCCTCCSPFLPAFPEHSSGSSTLPPPTALGSPTMRLKDFLKQSSQHVLDGDEVTEPIADLFPQTTVMFADIAGFTAWSSEREPAQVFMLLESLYRAFDDVANKLGVFKLDTVGDCYMAVAGFPDPIEDHGMVMVRFALECRKRMVEVTRTLEVLLGPDTADLAMRFGIHSGPVTAGVLRGKHARFQLIGDTVNLAARMEYTGRRDCIQLSQDTADIIIAAGKSDWITPRDDPITIKGRGEMQTYWLNESWDLMSFQRIHVHSVAKQRRRQIPPELHFAREDSFHVEEIVESATVSSSSNSKTTIFSEESQRWGGGWDESMQSGQYSKTTLLSEESQRWGEASLDHINFIAVANNDAVARSEREQRLIDWITKVLLRHLKKVLAQRAAQDAMSSSSEQRAHRGPTGNYTGEDEILLARSDVFNEVAEIITLPRFDTRMRGRLDAERVDLPSMVQAQLREYVTRIASLYHENPFHNFEHASHVTMSVNKLLKRIVSPDHVSFGPLPEYSTSSDEPWLEGWELHDSTFGIASDSLTQFAVVFAALIHDVDHQGVPNSQLVKEKSRVSELYHGKSVAEQNSVDVAWTILLEPSFNELRSSIYATEAERKRFRQLVVNCVLATDIVDEELQSLRKRRWDKAFDREVDVPARAFGLIHGRRGSGLSNVDRKATIVIEHIIQASDVAHTMQHWHIYVKWNERLFKEMLGAYLGGRADKDPSIGWYECEISFFDNYITPLARKLKECGVFGVSGEEYLNYALENRMEWKRKGQDMCTEWKHKFLHSIH